MLLKIADRMEANLERLAYAETVDNGPRDAERRHPAHRRPFPLLRRLLRPGRRHQRDRRETPWPTTSTSRWAWSARSFPGTSPILMAAWKLAPALGAGNCVVLKAGRIDPISILVLMELIADLLPRAW